MTSLQPRDYIAEWFRFFHVTVEGQRGAFRQRSFPATSGRGARDLQTCPNFWPMANGYTDTKCYYTQRRIWTKDVWKRAILRADVIFHQISSPLPPKSHFGDLSMRNLLNRELSVSRTLIMELRSWNFIVIMYRQLLKVCQFFSARGRPRGAGPPNVILGPPIISETTRARKLKLKTQIDEMW